MKKKSLALEEVYRLLEPGPVVLVTTARGGQVNVMTMSWTSKTAVASSGDANVRAASQLSNLPAMVVDAFT